MIASVGDAGIDLYVTTGKKFVGGIAANVAVHLSRLHEPVCLISAVGSDEHASFVLHRLQEEGLDVSQIQQLPGHTSVQKIRSHGKLKEFFGFRPEVLAQFRLTPETEALCTSADILFTPLSDGLKPVFEQVMTLHAPNTKKAVDFSRDADIPGFAHGDVIAMVHHYIDQLHIAMVGGNKEDTDSLRTIAQAHPDKIVILTCGADGSFAWHQGQEYTQQALWVRDVVDTTGCGDAWRAGFLYDYVRNHNVQQAMNTGARMAARIAGQFGAF